MFARIYTLFVALSVASYVSAAAALFPLAGLGSHRSLSGVAGARRDHIGDSNDCNTGSIQCCNTTQDSKGEFWQNLFGVLGGGFQNIEGLIGLNCNPIAGFGKSGSQNCAAQPVCCEGTKFNGLVAFGCNPINIVA